MEKELVLNYIFDFIINEFNLILFNDNQTDLLAFRDDCYKVFETGSVMNLWDKNTLTAYDNAVRLLASLIFEKVPDEENLDIGEAPDLEDVKLWLSSLQFDDYILILAYLEDHNLIKIESEEDLQFLVNVYITNKEMTNAEYNSRS
jgi:hypothetical protein